MKIRTQFFITMAVFGVMLAVIGVSLATTAHELSRLNHEQETAVSIGSGARDLSYLSGDYLLYREPQQSSRWRSRWEAVAADVASLEPETAEERILRDRISANLTRLNSVFEEVAGSRDETASGGSGSMMSDASFQVSWSRLAVQSQGTAFEALRLSDVLRNRSASVNTRNTWLVSVLLFLFAVYFVVMYLIVYRRAVRAVVDLRVGTRAIGAGDLDYVIPVTHNDEIGDLSRAINRMAADLKGVTASKTQLEREVADREKAEVALRQSLRRIEQLKDAGERELETTKLLLGAAEALAEWTDLDRVLEALADIVLAATEHTRVTVHMWDAVQRTLHRFVVRGASDPFPIRDATAWGELSDPARELIRAMRPMVIDYDALSEENQTRVAQTGARLGLAVPLVYRQRLLGLVFVDDPGERREFGERETELILGIAAQAAVAVENVRHYNEERRVADALRAIFQRPVPEIDGIELGVIGHYASEAERVGGDFYDAFALGDEVAVLVGDVAGKGLTAVGLTERVRGAVRTLAYAGETLSPGYLLTKTNESLAKQLVPGEFVTAVLVTIDPSTGSYRIARAGHTLPVICGGDCVLVDTPAGPPLGVVEMEYPESTGVLAPGETLVLYTDGVTEARRDGGLYGEQRLLEALSGVLAEPNKTVQALFADVEEYARGSLADDLLIVALRRAGASDS